MKKTLLLLVSFVLLLAGCNRNSGTGPAAEPEIVLTEITDNQMAFPCEGAQAKVLYTVVNPAEGGMVSAAADAEWVSDIDCSAEGVIAFNVLENVENGSRSAIFTIAYEWSEGKSDLQINLCQAGSTDLFDIQVPEEDVTAATARVITSCLGEFRWFDGLVATSVIEENPDFEAVVMSDFMALVDRYAEQGYSIDDILYAYDYVDDYVWTGLSQKTSYTPYAFGMDLEYNFTTDIHLGPEFTTGEIEYKDLTFDLKVEPKQTSALLDIVPSDENVWYFATVIGDSFDESGYTDEQIMEFLCNTYGEDLEKFALMGSVSGREVKGMSPGTHYTAVAFGIDLDSYMYNSAMARAEFYTAGSGETEAYATGNLDNYWLVSDLVEYNPDYAEEFRVDAGNPLLAAMVLEFNDAAVGAYYASWIGDMSAMEDMLFEATIKSNFYAEKDGCVNFFYMNYNAASTLCVVAVDAEGNFGDMYMEVTNRTIDGVSKDFALFDKYYSEEKASSSSFAVRQPLSPMLPEYSLTVSTGPDSRTLPSRSVTGR